MSLHDLSLIVFFVSLGMFLLNLWPRVTSIVAAVSAFICAVTLLFPVIQ